MAYVFPHERRQQFKDVQPAIQQRLAEFAAVPTSEYFYELCFCVCTPQSKARHAHAVVEQLRMREFATKPFNPTDILRQPECYVRFHNTKARRLLAVQQQFPTIAEVLHSAQTPQHKRLWLAANIQGIGMKEAAHFLRNIGYRNLGILDRHILRHLVQYKVFPALPSIGTVRSYSAAEQAFAAFADAIGIPMDELDLFFWYLEAGEIFK